MSKYHVRFKNNQNRWWERVTKNLEWALDWKLKVHTNSKANHINHKIYTICRTLLGSLGLEIRAGHIPDCPKLASDHSKFVMRGQSYRPLFSAHIKQFLFRDVLECVYHWYIFKLLSNHKSYLSSSLSTVFGLPAPAFKFPYKDFDFFQLVAAIPHTHPLPENTVGSRLTWFTVILIQ